MQYFDFLACSRLMCFRVFVFVSPLAKASKTQSLNASNLQVASAGDAKRKQSARPSGGWARACRIRPVPNPSLPFPTSPRIALRGHRLHLVFFDFFLVSNFSFQNPSQSLSKGPPWDPKITKNLIFSFQNRPKDHPFVRFSVDLCFYHFLDEFLVIFSGQKRYQKWCVFSQRRLFFWNCRPLR